MVQPLVGRVQLSFRRVWRCAAALLLSGCVCNENICAPVMGTPPATTVFATAGAPVTVPVVLPITCGTRTSTGTVVSVLDPTISTVEATAGEPRSVAGSGFEVVVTFTPTQPGAHHLAVRFEPNFGVAQLDVLVAAEMRDAGSVTVDQPCARGDFSPGGLALCTNDSTVAVLQNGAQVQTLTGSITARYGGTLWVSDGTRVQRWVEDAGAFELTGTATASRHRSIIPSTDDALLLPASGTSLQRWADGGIAPVAGPAPPSNDAMWRRGADVALIRNDTRGWCVAQVPGYDGGQRCTVQTSRTVVGLEPEGIWVQNETAAGPEAMVFDHLSQSGFTLPPGWSVVAPAGGNPLRWDTGVMLDGGSADAGGPYVLRKVAGSVILENYGPRVRFITSTAVTVPEGSSTRLIKR